MNLQAVYHQPKSNYCYAYNDSSFHIRIRAATGDLTGVVLVYGDKFEWDKRREIVMECTCKEGLFDYYTVEIPFMKRLAYYFEIMSESEVFYYTQWGIVSEFDQNQTHFYHFQYPDLDKNRIHKVPDWVKDSIFYEIFPDRFCNGNIENDSENVETWGAKPRPASSFGGDLDGIIEKVGYLKELGINAVYLTPVFQSGSNHKYDTEDYFTVDSHFGDLITMKKLVAVCHENGIRVILDGVFNHCSSKSEHFKDVLEHGRASPYFNWFHIHELPVKTNPPNYDTFSVVRDMPKLNTKNKDVIDYLLSAVRYWMEQTDIDGWRLDVADELDPEFLRMFRKNVKEYNEDAYIVGEAWHSASAWLFGDQLDAVMNYQFAMACMNYFALQRMDSKGFIRMINKVFMDYTKQVTEVTFNLLDCHDTLRFLTMCGGDVRKLLLALTFLFTYTGAPCIYYGTEIGMEGGEDPDCRRTFPWNRDEWNVEVNRYTKKLIQLRRELEALRRGSFAWLECESKVIVYERKLPNQRIIVILNNNEENTEVDLNLGKSTFTELLSEQKYEFLEKSRACITLPGFSARILLRE